MSDRSDLIKHISDLAVVHGKVTLASGKEADYYVDMRRVTLDGAASPVVGRVMNDLVADLDFDAVGGLTLGADPLANALAVISFQRGKPVKAFIVRKEAKGHGTKSKIEGNVRAGERVVILDDVITTGGSTITAIEQARRAGLVVDRVITLIDREEGGRENILQHADCVSSVFTRTEIMALREEILSGQQRT